MNAFTPIDADRENWQRVMYRQAGAIHFGIITPDGWLMPALASPDDAETSNAGDVEIIAVGWESACSGAVDSFATLGG